MMKLVAAMLTLSVVIAAANTITITCPDNNCTVGISSVCTGAINLSLGCTLGVIP
jgi:hypothetical protein